MLSTSEILSKKFDKSGMFGYKAEEVDRFIKEVAKDYDKLQTENEQLERKLEVLADKINEYREEEDSLRSAILGAQKLGDSVVRESKQKAEIILTDANVRAQRIVEDAQRQIETERLTLSRMQKEVALFKNKLLTSYRKHIELISTLPGEEVETAAEEPETEPVIEPIEEPVEEPVLEIAEPQAEEQLEFSEIVEEPEENAEEKTETVKEEKKEPVSRIESKFGPLKFGSEYNLRK